MNVMTRLSEALPPEVFSRMKETADMYPEPERAMETMAMAYVSGRPAMVKRDSSLRVAFFDRQRRRHEEIRHGKKGNIELELAFALECMPPEEGKIAKDHNNF